MLNADLRLYTFLHTAQNRLTLLYAPLHYSMLLYATQSGSNPFYARLHRSPSPNAAPLRTSLLKTALYPSTRFSPIYAALRPSTIFAALR